MITSYYNHIVEATALSVSSENYNYPRSNLQEFSKWPKFRSLSNTGQWIKITAAASTASYLFIDNHNITSAATILLQGNNTDVWTTPSLSEVVTWSAGLIVHSFIEQTFNFWRLYISDPTNPSAYIQIGLLHLGPVIQWPGMDPAQSLPVSTESKKSISQSRQVFGDDRGSYREFEVAFKFVTNLQRLNINALFEYCLNVRPFYLLPWESNLTFEPPMYALIADKTLKWKRNNNSKYPWSLQVKFEEVF